jgi:hypothetical protein
VLYVCVWGGAGSCHRHGLGRGHLVSHPDRGRHVLQHGPELHQLCVSLLGTEVPVYECVYECVCVCVRMCVIDENTQFSPTMHTHQTIHTHPHSTHPFPMSRLYTRLSAIRCPSVVVHWIWASLRGLVTWMPQYDRFTTHCTRRVGNINKNKTHTYSYTYTHTHSQSYLLQKHSLHLAYVRVCVHALTWQPHHVVMLDLQEALFRTLCGDLEVLRVQRAVYACVCVYHYACMCDE